MSDEPDIPPTGKNPADEEVLAASRKRTRRSFAIGATLPSLLVLATASIAGSIAHHSLGASRLLFVTR